jgi:hypothetical protein
MIKAIGLAVALLWATTATAQTPPDTFKAGFGEAHAGFYLGDQVDSERVAILLPEELSGTVVYSIRASFRPPNTGAVSPEVWANSAKFTWGLSEGTAEQPEVATIYKAAVPLSNYPDLRIGGWATVQTEWAVLLGSRTWLIGYWHKNAKYVRLTQVDPDTNCVIAIGYKQSGVESWQMWSGTGLEVEVSYGAPGQGVPSGIFDPVAIRPDSPSIRAGINFDGLTISLYSASETYESYSPYNLLVVNTLGQTVVREAGIADFGQIRIPWGADRPSGVYFCRIRLGQVSYTVPVVNLK